MDRKQGLSWVYDDFNEQFRLHKVLYMKLKHREEGSYRLGKVVAKATGPLPTAAVKACLELVRKEKGDD